MPKKNHAVIGIDVGGTKTLCVLADANLHPLERIKFKTEPNEGRTKFTETLTRATGDLAKRAGKAGLKLKAVGVGCAGNVDTKKLRIISSANLLCLENYPIGKYLKQQHNVEVTLENDVRMGVYGEYKLGAAVNAENVLGVFFGTGVGGAAIINGQLHMGASGMGGQVGCLLAQPVGGPEAAMSHGIIDRIASKAAIAGEALVMAVKRWAPYLHNKVGTDLSKVTWGMIRKAIEHGDKQVEEMLRARMRVVGIALSDVVNFLNPEVMVVGGGLIEALADIILEELEEGVRQHLVAEVNNVFKVKQAQLGGDAVALGAACAAYEASRRGKSKNTDTSPGPKTRATDPDDQ